MVLRNAYELKESSFGISEQYPAEINNRRKNLYPIMREAKQQRRHVVLVRDGCSLTESNTYHLKTDPLMLTMCVIPLPTYNTNKDITHT